MKIHEYRCVLNRNETSEGGYESTIQLPMFRITSLSPETSKGQIIKLTGSNRISGAIMDINTGDVWNIEQGEYL